MCFLALLQSQVFEEISFNKDVFNELDLSLTQLEMNLQQLETENNLQKNLLKMSKEALNEQATYSANLKIQLQESENALTKSEKSMKRWRMLCIVTSGIAIGTNIVWIIQKN